MGPLKVPLVFLIALAGTGCGAAPSHDQGPAVPTASAGASSDTVYVRGPTGDTETDRTNIQAAFEAVQPGGAIAFAPGTYLLGGGAQLTVPDVTVLGHPDGTVLRGCDPEAFRVEASQIASVVFGCTGLYIQAERQTIRGLTFEYTWHGIVVGPYPTTVAEAEGGDDGPSLPASYPAGGQRIEGNTFRATPNGIRVLGHGDDLSVVRDNDFIDVFHAIGIYGAPLHFLDNRVTVKDPGRVPYSGHPGSAIIVSPGHTDCAGHVVAGNHVEGYPDPIYVLAGRGETCRGVEIRDNIIRAARVKVPQAWEGYTPTDDDSTMVGTPITLMNILEPVPGMPEADTEGVLEDILVEGNHILGAEGLGILVQNASRIRIVGNTIADIRRRAPFPGMTWDGFEQRWEAANGSAIWVSPGSDRNEIVDNAFDDIASAAVFLEGDGNRVDLTNSEHSVRDLGTENRVVREAPTGEEWSDPSAHTSSFVSVGGVRVHYLDWGGSGQAMLFVPGAGNTAHVFDDFAPRFVDDYRVVAITRVGFGESDMPSGVGYSLAERVAHMEAVLDSLDLTEVVLVGHSLGGDEITGFAAEHPDRVVAVIYLDAAYDHVRAREWETGLAALDATPPMPAIEELGSVWGFQQYLTRVRGVTVPVGEVLASFRFDSAGGFQEPRSPPRVRQETEAATEPPDFARVRAPALAIYADHRIPQDLAPWLPGDSAAVAWFEEVLRQAAAERERVAAALPRLSVVMRRNHHYQFLSEPDWTEAAVRSFLASVPAAAHRPPRNAHAESSAADAVVRWLSSNAIRLDTVEPGSGSRDLRPLEEVVGDARIVALGEPTHGNREVFQLKHRMIEFLVTELGFNVFGLESPMAETFDLNEYVLTGIGDPSKALAGIRYWTWDTQEVLAVIEWIRDYNADPAHVRKVSFYGFDVQDPERAARVTLEYLQRVDPVLAEAVLPELGIFATPFTLPEYAGLRPIIPREGEPAAVSAIGKVMSRLDARRDDYIAATSAAEWTLARQHAQLLARYIEASSNDARDWPAVRDRGMAENVRWILDREGDDAKVILWAHNIHVANAFPWGIQVLGSHLRRMFGPELVIFGFLFDRGGFRAIDGGVPSEGMRTFTVGPAPEGTVEAMFATAGLDLALVDLRRIPAAGAVAEWFRHPRATRHSGGGYNESDPERYLLEYDVPEAFDALVFVDSTTPVRPVNEADYDVLWVEEHILPAPVNLDFESGRSGEAPEGWLAWSKHRRLGFDMATTTQGPHGGSYSGVVRRAPGQRYGEAAGSLSQRIDATPYRGKTVRLRAAARANLADGGSFAFLRLAMNGPPPENIHDSPTPSFDSLDEFRVTSSEWRIYEIVAPVPDDAVVISYGLFLAGAGSAWIDDVSIEVEYD